MKTLQFTGAAVLIAALAACAPEFEANVYYQDIADVLESGDAINVPAKVRIPQVGIDKCNETIPSLFRAMNTIMPVEGEVLCVKDGYNTFAELETTVPMFAPDNGAMDGTFLLSFSTGEVTASDGTKVTTIKLNMHRSIEDIRKALQDASDDFRFMPSFDTPVFEVTFDNDTREPVRFVPNHGYVNGMPDVTGGKYDLDRRDTVTLRLSDVASSYLSLGNSFVIAFSPQD